MGSPPPCPKLPEVLAWLPKVGAPGVGPDDEFVAPNTKLEEEGLAVAPLLPNDAPPDTGD